MPKHLSILILLILLSLSAHANPKEESNNTSGSVVMSWEKYQELLKKAESEKISKNKSYSYEKAVYSGIARIEKEKYHIDFKAKINVSTFKDRDTLIPFLSGDLSLESLKVDGLESTFALKDGFFRAHVYKKGHHKIEATFTIILNSKNWPRNFYLPLVKIARSEIRIDIPDKNVEAEFDTGVALETEDGTTGDIINGYFPAVSGVHIKWLKKNAAKKKIPLKMIASVHSYISLEEKGAGGINEVTFKILQGESNFFSINIPETVDILEVTSVDSSNPISQWFTEDNEKGRQIKIFSSYRQSSEFGVKVVYEHTETKVSYNFKIPNLSPAFTERFEYLVAIGSRATVEINEDKIDHVERRDVRFLPPEIKNAAGNHALYYYKILDKDFLLSFNVKSHEKAKVMTTRIEQISADSVFTETGTLMTKVTYNMRNNQAQYMRLTLPENSKLLSVFLKGGEAQPALDGEILLIPIAKSAENSFNVEIAYLTKRDRFSKMGKEAIKLPETHLPAGELSWRLYVPESFHFIWFGGNIDRTKYNLLTRLNWMLGALFEGETNAAFAGGRENYGYSEKSLKKRFKKNSSELNSIDSFDINQIQVEIPVTGKKYRFESYLVKGFTPEISFYYMHDIIKNSITMIYSSVFFIILLWTFMFILEKNALYSPLRKWSAYLKGLSIVVFLCLLLFVFSFGTGGAIVISLLCAAIYFSFLQNRLVAKRYHEKVKGIRSYLTEFILMILFFSVVLAFITGLQFMIAFVCLCSIVFHAMFPMFGRIINAIQGYLKKRKQISTTLIVLSFFGILFIVPSVSFADTNSPMPEGATATIPLHKMEDILKKIDDKKNSQSNKLKYDYIFGNVMVTGKISEKHARLKVSVPLSILSDNFVKIPVFPSHISITNAIYNNKSLTLFEDNGSIFFEVKSDIREPVELQMDLIVPVNEKGGVHEFVINTPLFRGGTLSLSFGEEIKSVMMHGVTWQKRNGQKIKAALDGSKGLRCELATFQRKKDMADETSIRVKKIYSTTHTLLTLNEEIATFYSSIRYRILNNRVRSFEIRLPKDVIVHEIVGDDLEEWKKGDSAADGTVSYIVKVLYPVAGKYDLSVQYEKSIGKDKDNFIIPVLDVSGVARDVGYLGIEMQAQAEIDLNSLKKAHLIDIQELPQIIRSDALSPFVFAFRYVERPYEISLKLKKHINHEMDPAIADRIVHTTIISPMGKNLCQSRMWIRNSRKQFASFILPEGAKVLSAFLDNKSIKPSIGKKGELLLPLKRQSVNPFILDVVYEGPDVKLNKTGGFTDIEFPGIDIPASIVTSDIYYPEKMFFSDPLGDFSKASVAGYVSWSQNKLNMGSTLSESTQADIPAAEFNQQIVMNTMQLQEAKRDEAGVGGTLSLKIELPKHGRIIKSSAFYIPEMEKLNIKFFSCSKVIYFAGYTLSIILIIGAACCLYLSIISRDRKKIMLTLALCLVLYFIPVSWEKITSLLALGFFLSYISANINKKIRRVSDIPDPDCSARS